MYLALIVTCLGGCLAVGPAVEPHRSYMPNASPPFNPYPTTPSISEDCAECHPFKACGTDGWSCEGEKPEKYVMDCGNEISGMSFAVSNISESAKSLTIRNCHKVKIFFKGTSILKELIIENSNGVILVNSEPPNRYVYGYTDPQTWPTIQRSYPNEMTIQNCTNVTLDIADNGKGRGMKRLYLKNAEVTSAKVESRHVREVVWTDVTARMTSIDNNLYAEMAGDDTKFEMIRCNINLPFRIVTHTMLFKDSTIQQLGWEQTVTANKSYTLEGCKVGKITYHYLTSNDILMVNNEIDALHSVFGGINMANIPSCDCQKQGKIKFNNNTIRYMQAGALDPPQDTECGCNFNMTFTDNKVECSCRNVNWAKSMGYDGNSQATGRQIVNAENFLNSNNMCSNLPCEVKYAVWSYRTMCSSDLSNICPQPNSSYPVPFGASPSTFVMDSSSPSSDRNFTMSKMN